MIIETKLQFKDYLKLMYILTYRKPVMILLTILGSLMFVGAIFYFLGFQVPVDEPPYFQIVFGFFIIAVLPFSVYRSSKKNFISHGRLQEKITYEFTEEKMKQTGESFNSEMDWSKIFKVQELRNWILIYQSKQLANILPKSSFGDNLNEFKNLVKSKNIKAKLK